MAPRLTRSGYLPWDHTHLALLCLWNANINTHSPPTDVQVICNGTQFFSEATHCEEEEAVAVGSTAFYTYMAICIGLVLAAGVFSGLTLGLLSLDPLTLRALKNQGHPHEKKYAAKLESIVKNHHLLLVTLLLANAGVNEALPLFLDKLVPSPIYAILISVTAVLIFGEVIPQALCSRYGMAIGLVPNNHCLCLSAPSLLRHPYTNRSLRSIIGAGTTSAHSCSS